MTKYKAQLSSQMGEALVVAELGRRGIVATAFSGNVPNNNRISLNARREKLPNFRNGKFNVWFFIKGGD